LIDVGIYTLIAVLTTQVYCLDRPYIKATRKIQRINQLTQIRRSTIYVLQFGLTHCMTLKSRRTMTLHIILAF